MSAAAAPEQARVIIEVVAGLIPGKDPDPAYTRRYVITSADWHAAVVRDHETGPAGGDNAHRVRLLTETNGAAQGYAAWLMAQPDALNWVRLDWIWL